ncbi:beta-alanine-activating enzyme-like isoform X2 [Montipora capricornis]
MFVTFAAGARLVMVPDSVKMVPSKLCEILFDVEKVTVLQPTPSLMHYFGEELIKSKVLNVHSSLRVLAFGGECCPTLSTLRKWRPPSSNTLIYNLYGITEVSCWASCYPIPIKHLVNNRCSLSDGDSFDEMPGDIPVDLANDIPVGRPLLNTVIEVRGESGSLVQEGMGQIYIGGSDRVCLLGDERSLVKGTMRATGDWAFVKDSCIWFCGRNDRQIKRMGKRINLDSIEREISEVLPSKACSLVLEKLNNNHSRIHLFVVGKYSSDKKNDVMSLRRDLVKLLPHEAQPDCIHIVSHLPMTAHGKVNRAALLTILQKIPDSPGTRSVREFLELAWKESLLIYDQSKTPSFLGKHLENHDAENVMEDDMFLACGGSSLSAVRLADLIESWICNQGKVHVELHELLDNIFNKTFGSLCIYVESKLSRMLTEARGDSNNRPPQGNLSDSRRDDLSTIAGQNIVDARISLESNSTMGETGITEALPKRKLLAITDRSSHLNENNGIPSVKRFAMKNPPSIENNNLYHNEMTSSKEARNCFCSVRRCNQFNFCEVCRNFKLTENDNAVRQTQTFGPDQKGDRCHFVSSNEVEENTHLQSLSSSIEKEALGFKVVITSQWCTCLYKCIDASPLVVHSPGRCEGEVFIGSHGHVFMCIQLSGGEVLWERKVEDRIESSATLSACGKFVIVGCYDGKVYVFNRCTGETHWTFQTGAAVKSSPCIDPQTGVAWCGSHDQHVYGLDVINKKCICAIHCGGGSCFSSPCSSSDLHLVFIATLSGRVLAIHTIEHAIVWSQQCPKPIFASLLLLPTGIACACVDGCIYCFDYGGKSLWKFETRAPIFCSPTFMESDCHSLCSGHVVFGSHDNNVYCLSPCGELQWTFSSNAQVYSSPFIAELKVTNCDTTCHATCNATCKKCDSTKARRAVFVVTTVGTINVLDLYSGVRLGLYSLPGEIFSSPVVVDKRILVGCRNDYLYCLEITTA